MIWDTLFASTNPSCVKKIPLQRVLITNVPPPPIQNPSYRPVLIYNLNKLILKKKWKVVIISMNINADHCTLKVSSKFLGILTTLLFQKFFNSN